MHILWKGLKYVPSGLLTGIKRLTSTELRLWIREHFGGSYRTIPDKVITVADGRRFHIGPDYIYWALHIGLDFEPEASSVLKPHLPAPLSPTLATTERGVDRP